MLSHKYIKAELEAHYYSADKKNGKRVLKQIDNEDKKSKLDAYEEKHGTVPPNKTIETGYSALVTQYDDILTWNTSLLTKKTTFFKREFKLNGHPYARKTIDKVTLARKDNAPALALSCLESTEHVVALPDNTPSFVAHNEPKEKNHVYFQILVQSNKSNSSLKMKLVNIIREADSLLTSRDISIEYDIDKEVFTIEVGTQKANIKAIIAALSASKCKIINCDFSQLKLNQGICLVKLDGSNPIHAMPVVAKSETDTIFIERNAGQLPAISYSAANSLWLFRPFTDLNQIFDETGYNQKTTRAIQILKHF